MMLKQQPNERHGPGIVKVEIFFFLVRFSSIINFWYGFHEFFSTILCKSTLQLTLHKNKWRQICRYDKCCTKLSKPKLPCPFTMTDYLPWFGFKQHFYLFCRRFCLLSLLSEVLVPHSLLSISSESLSYPPTNSLVSEAKKNTDDSCWKVY